MADFVAGVGLGAVMGFGLFVTILYVRGWSIAQPWDHDPWPAKRVVPVLVMFLFIALCVWAGIELGEGVSR